MNSSPKSETALPPTKINYAGLSRFVVEYALFFLYVYSIVMVGIQRLAVMGWMLFMGTHFISTVNALLKTFARIREPVASVIFACFVLVLVGLFYVVLGLYRVQQSHKNVQLAEIPAILQKKLDKITPFLITDIVLLYVVLFAFKTEIFRHIFPFYMVPSAKQEGKFTVEMIRLRDYPYLTNYLWIWILGGCQIAVLGLSPYIVYLTNAFYVETLGLF